MPCLNTCNYANLSIYVTMFIESLYIISSTAHTLLNSRLFRKAARQISLLDLPGSILFIPQDSLLGELVPEKKMQYKGGCEPWWGAQLYSSLVSICRDLMAESAKCSEASVKVEHGVYGQKQEVVLNSLEPLTHLLEFWGTAELCVRVLCLFY